LSAGFWTSTSRAHLLQSDQAVSGSIPSHVQCGLAFGGYKQSAMAEMGKHALDVHKREERLVICQQADWLLEITLRRDFGNAFHPTHLKLPQIVSHEQAALRALLDKTETRRDAMIL